MILHHNRSLHGGCARWLSSTFLCSFIYHCSSFFRFTSVFGYSCNSYIVLVLSVRIFTDSVYVDLLLSIYRNVSLSSFLLSSVIGSQTSACNYSTGDVLNAPLYVLISSLCMLSSFYSLLGKVVLYN